MKLQEIIDLGCTSVTAKVSGYQERGLFGCYQSFSSIRSIAFKIDPELMILEHETFWINDEDTLDYAIDGGEAILHDPEMYARADD